MGILYIKEKVQFERKEQIALFNAIPQLVKLLPEKKKGNLSKDYLNSL
jgi:hypothetical protein